MFERYDTKMTSADSEQLGEAYERDGYVIVRDMFSHDQMRAWKDELTEAMSRRQFDRTSGVCVWMGSDLPSGVFQAVCGDHLVQMLKTLIGNDVEYLSAKVVLKDSKTTLPSPWHQDWFYWEGAAKLSVWVALDDADMTNGCLKVIPGTHKQHFKKTVVHGEGFGNRIPDEDVADLEHVACEVQQGDAIFFHDLLVHGSYPNTVGADRWSLIATYRSGAERDESKTWQRSVLLAGQSVNEAKTAEL